jgi:hypothetical protein
MSLGGLTSFSMILSLEGSVSVLIDGRYARRPTAYPEGRLVYSGRAAPASKKAKPGRRGAARQRSLIPPDCRREVPIGRLRPKGWK